jgi:hypothetical protein
MKALISSLVVFLLTAAPAYAQIYKWVDEAGKTHYSDKAPVGGKKLDTVPDRISVYTPDPSLLARTAATAGSDPALSDKVDRLERQLHAERLARAQQQAELASFTQASQAAYERCVSERRVDCDAYGGAPYAGPIAVVPVRHRRPILVRTSFTGLTAGNVVGPGIMPGTFNGPNAITAGNFTFRTSIPAARSRGAGSF